MTSCLSLNMCLMTICKLQFYLADSFYKEMYNTGQWRVWCLAHCLKNNAYTSPVNSPMPNPGPTSDSLVAKPSSYQLRYCPEVPPNTHPTQLGLPCCRNNIVIPGWPAYNKPEVFPFLLCMLLRCIRSSCCFLFVCFANTTKPREM